MKKLSKILFLVLIITMLICSFSVVSNADEYDDYVEIEQEDTTTNEEDKATTEKEDNATTDKTEETDKEDDKQQTAGTADKNHANTGVFTNKYFIAIIIVSIFTIFVRLKLKKYNY